MKNIISLFLLIFLNFNLFSQGCDISDTALGAICNCDDCGVLNEDWVITSGATSVCEGEVFQVQATYDDIGVEVEYFRWQIISGVEIIIDTTIYNSNLYSFSIDDIPFDSGSCQNESENVNVLLNLLVNTIDCATGLNSCHNKIGPLTVIRKPQALMDFPDKACVGDIIDFENLSCFENEYLWDFDNGTTSTIENPSISFDTPGLYNVSLTVSNECGSETVFKIIEVLGLPEGFIEMSVPQGELCNPDTITLTLNTNEWISGNTGYFDWYIEPSYDSTNWCIWTIDSLVGLNPLCDSSITFVDSVFDSQVAPIIFNFPGMYEVTLNYGNYCLDTILYDTIQVYEPIEGSDLPTLVSDCELVNLNFEDLDFQISGDYTGINWTFIGGDPSSSNELDFGAVEFITNGQILLEVNAMNPCEDYYDTIQIELIEYGDANVPNPDPYTICQDQGLIPLYPAEAGGTYYYDNSEATFIINDSLDPSSLLSGTYTVEYHLNEGSDCPSSSNFTFEILEDPYIELGENTSVCESIIDFNPTILNATGDIDSYNWTVLDDSGVAILNSSSEFPLFTITESGLYSIILEVNSNECGSVTDTSSIEIIEYGDASVPNPDPYTICQGHGLIPLYPAEAGGTYYYNNSEATFIINDSLDPSSLLSGTYTVEYHLNEGSDCPSSSNFTFEILEDPYIELGENTSVCESIIDFNPTILNATGDIDSYNWTVLDDSGVAILNSSSEFPLFTISESGLYSIILEVNSNECGSVADTSSIEIIAYADASIPNPDPFTICQSQGLIPLYPVEAGGTYYYNNSEAAFIINDSLDPSSLLSGTYIIEYHLNEGSDCPSSSDFTFEILEDPYIELGENTSVCESITDFNPTILNATGDIDSYNWTVLDSLGVAILNSSNEFPLFSISESGTYSIILEVSSNECGVVSDTSEIFIQPILNVEIESSQNIYCQNAYLDTLSSNFSGGIWFGEGIIDSINGVFDPTILLPGLYYIDYHLDIGSCSYEEQLELEVISTEEVIALDTFICFTEDSLILNAIPTGGVFSGEGIIDSINGVFDPSGLGIGPQNLVYEFTDSNNCEIIEALIVEIDTFPIISFIDSTLLCKIDENIDLFDLLSIETNIQDGDFLFTGPGIIDSQLGILNPADLEPGFFFIYIDYFSRSCQAKDSITIELIELANLDITGDTTACIENNELILESNINGGLWTSSNCIVSNSGVVDLNENGVGSCVFYYTIESGTSCEQTDSIHVEIIDLTDQIIVPDSISLCYSNSIFTIPSFSPSNGVWSGEGIINDQLGQIDVSVLSQGQTYNYNYCLIPDENGCTACKQTAIKIDSLPSANFIVDNNICQQDSFQIMNTSSFNSILFSWDFGDSITIDSVFEPSYVYDENGQYQITLIAETVELCRDTFSQIVNIIELPVVDLVFNTTEGCAPLEVEYTNNSYGDNIQQLWLIGLDTFFDAQPTIVLDSVINDSIIPIEFIIYNSCAEESAYTEVLVFPNPLVDFGINDDEGCSPDTVFFANATLGNPESFLWDFGNGNISTSFNPNPQIYYSPDDSISTYTISLSATNFCGTGYLEKEIIVYPNNVDAFFEVDTLSGCPPLEVNVTNYATVGSFISYDFGDGGTYIGEDLTYLYEEPGEYLITQYAALCGHDIYVSDTITVFPLANVSFEAPNYSCLGDTVFFENFSTEGIGAEWHFGDGFISNDYNPTHVYNESGVYEVMLIMYSTFNNCPDTLVKEIFIPESPIPLFSAPLQICQNESIQFVNQSIGGLNYQWDFGDGNGSELFQPNHNYSSSGVYDIELAVFDEFQCSSDTTMYNLIVNDLPSSDFEVSNFNPCQFHDTIQINNISAGFISSEWILNGQTLSTNNNGINLNFDQIDSNEIELVVTNIFNCKDSTSQFIDVLPSPIAISNIIDTSGCQPLSLDFLNLSEQSNLTYWYFQNGNSSVENGFQFIFNEFGNIQAYLIASNTNGCPSDTQLINIDVLPRSIADFEIIEFDSCGSPTLVEFINQSEYSQDFNWTFGTQETSNLFEPSINFENTGEFNVELITSNSYGCMDTIDQSIEIFPQPIANFALPNFEYCEGDSITAINLSENYTNSSWFWNENEIEDFPIVFSNEGVYSITLVTDFLNKCFDTISLNNIVEIISSPNVNFYYDADYDNFLIGEVEFINTSVSSDNFQWFINGNIISDGVNLIYEFNENGPAEVCLLGYNSNSNQFLCEDIICDWVDYERIHTFFVPNAFSPTNNFGNNEVSIFKAKGLEIESYELNIYSPWGDKIITLNEVLNGSPNDYWDGTFNGENLPQGAYLWTASVKFISGRTEFYKGNVTLIR